MLFLLPVGRKATLFKFPWFTVGLITINILVFLLTWPEEKKFLTERVSYEQLSYMAHQLTDILTTYDSGISGELRSRLIEEKKSPDFPTPFVEDIFKKIGDNRIGISPQARYLWELNYPHYVALQSSLQARPEEGHSVFGAYGFSGNTPIFPNVLTYQFLHAGFLHIFFNMLFLWLVGCNMEERWGPILFLSIYFLGGLLAAVVQLAFYPEAHIPMVGASGSVAAVMGAFLVRHAKVKIRIFYLFWLFFWIRLGVFEVPAWIALLLWFFQQLFMGLMTVAINPEVGYWAHMGGFVFGVVAGIYIRTFKMGDVWEKKAEETLEACDLKLEKGFSALYMDNLVEAERIFREVINIHPDHLRAHQGLLHLYEKRNSKNELLREVIEIAKIAMNSNNEELLNDMLGLARSIDRKELNDSILFQLGTLFERAKEWDDASQFYRQIIDSFTDSPYLAKSLFSLGKILKQKLFRKEEARGYFERLLHPPYDMEWGAVVRNYLKE